MGEVIRFPFTPRLVGRDTTPAEDPEYALRQSAVRHIKIKVGAADLCEGMKPSDSE